jgi:hypothetical protein
MHRHELEEAGNPDAETGQVYYQNIEKIFDQDYGPTGEATAGKGAVQTPSPSVTATNDQRQGVSPQSDDGDQPRNVLEQDRWLALPGEKRLRFVTVTVDEATGLVLRLVRQEIDDVRDRQRYERDIQVVDSEHEANLAQYEAVLPELQMQRDQAAAIARTMIDPATGLFPEGVQAPQIPELPPPPMHPGYNSIRSVKRVPFRRFTHYVCFPNPEGYYGYGLGYLIEGHNMAADEVMTLYTSLLRMNLVPTFFHPRFNNMNQEIKLKLGEGNPLPVTAAEMGDKLLQFVQFPQGDANAFKVEERQSTAVQEITADNIISGAPGMSGQTATETDVRAANAMDNIAMIGSRINRARTQEVQTLAHALSQTLDDETFPVEGEGDVEEYMITREDYQDSFDVYVTADPDFASQPQKEARAMKLIGGLGQVPPEAVDPVSFALLWRAALVKLLKATKDEDLVPIVANAQQPQMPGPPPPPEGEEMMEGQPNEESDQGPPPGDGGQPMEPPAGDAGPAQMPQ